MTAAELMTANMDKHQRRANRILRQFGHYVDEAAGLDVPTIARTKPSPVAGIWLPSLTRHRRPPSHTRAPVERPGHISGEHK